MCVFSVEKLVEEVQRRKDINSQVKRVKPKCRSKSHTYKNIYNSDQSKIFYMFAARATDQLSD